jgi:hypothetical protein
MDTVTGQPTSIIHLETLEEYEASRPEWMRRAFDEALQFCRDRLAEERALSRPPKSGASSAEED